METELTGKQAPIMPEGVFIIGPVVAPAFKIGLKYK